MLQEAKCEISKVVNIFRNDASALSRREHQMHLIRSRAPSLFEGADRIEATGAQHRGEQRREHFIQVEPHYCFG